MDTTPTSVIIVTSDSGPSLRECVRRVLASDDRVEVIIADNGSSDGVPPAVERAYANDARLQVMYLRHNLGFGPAVNRAAQQARGDMLMVLNPDCMIEADTVRRLREAASAPRVGLVGAVVCDADGTPDPASRRRDPYLRRALNTLTGRAGKDDGGGAHEGVNVPGPMPDGPIEVEAVSGAVMMMPTAAFLARDGFDEAYFLHCEDLDLCRRMRDAGYRVLLAGHVRVMHAKGGSSGHRPVFVSRHKHRGMWRWFRKFDPAAGSWLTRAMVWTGLWMHFLLGLPGLMARPGRRPSAHPAD